MKILWITNIKMPEFSMLLREKPQNCGGWLVGLSGLLSSDAELSIICPSKSLIYEKGKNIVYYTFTNIDEMENVVKNQNFDIIHIWGTEFKHSLEMVNICEKLKILDKCVISIQGLVSVYSHHYFANLPNNVVNSYTFRDLIKGNIKNRRNNFKKRGKFEIEAISKVKHIIGRTDWDKACSSQINDTALYHFCNEILRDSFYGDEKWDIEKIERHSIFLSQASYPIKGLHQMLHAMPLIMKKYPDSKIYIGGGNILKADTLKDKLKRTSYAKYIKKLIKKYKIENNVEFLTNLNEQQMKERYLKSNVFISPSVVENESNSISEAKILGVPVVASFVGGVTNRISQGLDGFLYPFDAPYMLAYYVTEIFGSDNLAINLGQNAIKKANETHDRGINLKTLLKIYEDIKNYKN